MNIIQDFIPAGRRNRPGRVNPMRFITIHNTGNANKGSGAKNHAVYLKGDIAAGLPVSWHYTADESGAYQHLPDNEDAFHAGDGAGAGNRQSIGIEICMNSDGDLRSATDNAARLTAILCKKYNISPENVVQHNRWTGKNCPQMIRNNRPYNWDIFISKVKNFISGESGLTAIAGTAIATAEQMRAYIKRINPDAPDFAGIFISESRIESIRGDIAFAQSCLETGNFRFAGSAVTLEQNNFCGMGVTQNGMKGNSFPTPQIGIRAQIHHLKAYANAEPLANPNESPRFRFVQRGVAPYAEWLGIQENPQGKGWAAGAGYGEKILRILSAVLTENAQPENLKIFAAPSFKSGDKVKIKQDAKIYATGQTIPDWVKSREHTIMQTSGERILLREIFSWVFIKDLQKI